MSGLGVRNIYGVGNILFWCPEFFLVVGIIFGGRNFFWGGRNLFLGLVGIFGVQLHCDCIHIAK